MSLLEVVDETFQVSGKFDGGISRHCVARANKRTNRETQIDGRKSGSNFNSRFVKVASVRVVLIFTTWNDEMEIRK